MTNDDFEKAVIRNNQRLFLLALSFTKSTHDAQDILQNVFLKLLKYSEEFTSDEHLDKWLTTVCVNESKNYIKSLFRKHQSIDDCEIVSPDIFENSMQSDLYNAVMSLPKKDRTVIHLFYYEDMSIKEISSILKSTESTVKTRLSRARKKLKEMLGDEWINE
ncbi:MAG: sigma-70 family RNA polymerase sigma factor [Ruminococcaceae bacterium]|nr:sigma-70 family RNA polymerase sigma factor [Oscillospiraceae bacterium]